MSELYLNLIHSMRDCLTWCNKYRDITPQEDQIPDYLRSNELGEELGGVNFTINNFNKFLISRHQMIENRNIGNLVSLREAEDEVTRPDSLLITAIDAMGIDGCEEPASRGFIDYKGNPPWDSWLAIGYVPQTEDTNCLISWVPIWAREFVDDLIQCHAIEYFYWGTVIEKVIEIKER